MTAATTCKNLRCTCDPCTCADCACGVSRLGDLERQVMEVLWAVPHGDLTGRTVADALPGHAYTTTATVLDRLVHKGLVRRRTEERTVRYTATGTRASHAAEVMREALVMTRDPEAVLARFVETMPSTELETLRRALDEFTGKS